jgi:hypothetical protein
MAITFVGAATPASSINGVDVAVDLTTIAGLAQNDLVIFAYSFGRSADVDNNMAVIEAGWTEVADLWANDVAESQLGVYYKKMGASVDTVVTGEGYDIFGSTGVAVAMAFRGVDTTTPMDVAATTATGLNTADPDPPSIDHNNPSGLWTVLVAASGHFKAGAPTYTFPTGYTTNATEIDGANGGDDAHVGMGYRTNPADPEDPGAMTLSGTDSVNYAWTAVTMALRPATATFPHVSIAMIGL